MQGCGPGNNPPRANAATAINGTTEARNAETQHEAIRSPTSLKAYGCRSVNKTGDPRVDAARTPDCFVASGISPLAIPGRAKREPGIHTPDRGYGFRVQPGACHRAAQSADPLGLPWND